MGRRWLQMIPASARDAFRAALPIGDPDPTQGTMRRSVHTAQALQQFRAVAGRAMDGARALPALEGTADQLASDNVAWPFGSDKAAADAAGPPSWPGSSGCTPRAEEEGGRCLAAAAAGIRVLMRGARWRRRREILAADEYYHGRLDWYYFDWDKSQQPRRLTCCSRRSPMDPHFGTRSFIPASVRFNGMPDTRWWAFEDGKTNFGDIKAGTTDSRSCCSSSSAWCTRTTGSCVPVHGAERLGAQRHRGLAVTNIFGERFWIEAAGRGADEAGSAGTCSARRQGDARPADLALLVLPTVPKSRRARRWRRSP